MVCIVVLKGVDAERAAKRLRRYALQAAEVTEGVWLAEMDIGPSELRDLVGDGIQARVLVAKLDGRWATKGFSDPSRFLRGSKGEF